MDPTTGRQPTPPSASERWRLGVEGWALPDRIGAAAPEPFVALEPERFRWRPDADALQPVRPSRRRALEALPEGGSVLDVGVGGGASSLGLAPTVGLITGVDPLPGMLASFEASARDAGVATRAVVGRWPEVADAIETADVAVCHHAVYGVSDIEPFLAALTASARHRVVLEVSAHPPLVDLNPLWKAFHGVERADRLVADEAEAVLAAMGVAVEREDLLLAPGPPDVTPERVAFLRKRLCVGPERDAEILGFLEESVSVEHRVVALWWPGRPEPHATGQAPSAR
ncbi:MAG: methyltransferase domain-containing protein [Acidimicrobiales bacterium]